MSCKFGAFGVKRFRNADCGFRIDHSSNPHDTPQSAIRNLKSAIVALHSNGSGLVCLQRPDNIGDPWRFFSAPKTFRYPSMISVVACGLTKLAVPIWTAAAPAIKNSSASSAVMMPPIPITGIWVACTTCHTIRRATGLMAGPESPPVMLAIFGPPGFKINGHTGDGIDQGKRIRTRCFCSSGDNRNIGHIRR